MRNISVGFPSGKAKMTLWQGTEDEESFIIKSVNKNPYVVAYGIKYELTEDEVHYLKQITDVINRQRKSES